MQRLGKNLGVNLTRTIALDDKPENYVRHPYNVLPVAPFFDDPNDHLLPQITPLLLAFAEHESIDAYEFTELMSS